jgi:hypothetical protein
VHVRWLAKTREGCLRKTCRLWGDPESLFLIVQPPFTFTKALVLAALGTSHFVLVLWFSHLTNCFNELLSDPAICTHPMSDLREGKRDGDA